MPGPPPKHPGQRRRTNSRAGRILPSEGPETVPDLPGRSKMLASTRAWWEAVWRSPMANAYLEADSLALIRLAQMIDLASRGEANAALLTEIRQLEDRTGLSPLARRRLEWSVAGPAEVHSLDSGKASARRERLARVRATDPRDLLNRPDSKGA